MTKKLSVSVPDDVADRVEREGNVSAYVTDAIRARIRAEQVTDLLQRRGASVSPEIRALMRAKLDANRREWPPERYADLRERLQQQIPGQAPTEVEPTRPVEAA